MTGAPVRVGAVSYLNTFPLVEGLAGPGLALSFAPPAALADRMAEGALDVALLPVAELARLPHLEIVPGLGIVTSGASRSVLLVSTKPVEDVSSVRLDPESRSSNALCRVLFAEVWGVRPEFRPGTPDLAECLADADAAVRIGDKALFEPAPTGTFVTDLGRAWTDATGLPFVFAVWAARPGVVDRELYRRLHDARRRGKRSIEKIARDYRYRGRAYEREAREYLEEAIRYRLGNPEIDGMKRFFALAERAGVVREAPPLRRALESWSPCHDTAVARGILPRQENP